jgi:predicted GH43/DUF377 family glycosyl hydrolase
MAKQLVIRKNIAFEPNIKRVILQFFLPGNEECAQRIVNRVLSLKETEVKEQANILVDTFKDRHKDYSKTIIGYFSRIDNLVPNSVQLSEDRKLLLSACFCREYSFEAAALMNPSIVAIHESNGAKDKCDFIVSTRAVGEGHISSVGFMKGEINVNGDISFDSNLDFAHSPKILKDINNSNNEVEIEFDKESYVSQRIIYPVTADECNGIEDLRLVRFSDDHNDIHYYGTYTAYDGKNIYIKFIETTDFIRFKMYRLSGKGVNNKGMALFPRKINGKYMMTSRQDGENLFIMESDELNLWEKPTLIRNPKMPWEILQLGNCGSPIETNEGWLLIIHGVGFMRQYVIGACLLDKDNPYKIIAMLKDPLISPNNNERDGYVPNVVYSCGSMIYNNDLVIPYAMSDYKWGIATVNVADLLEKME